MNSAAIALASISLSAEAKTLNIIISFASDSPIMEAKIQGEYEPHIDAYTHRGDANVGIYGYSGYIIRNPRIVGTHKSGEAFIQSGLYAEVENVSTRYYYDSALGRIADRVCDALSKQVGKSLHFKYNIEGVAQNFHGKPVINKDESIARENLYLSPKELAFSDFNKILYASHSATGSVGKVGQTFLTMGESHLGDRSTKAGMSSVYCESEETPHLIKYIRLN